MTPEQAKQLKKGDKILVAAEVDTVHNASGEAYIRISCFDGASTRITFNRAFTLADNIILPTDMQHPEKPKHDPCRLFKKGDKVRVVKNKGRKQKCSGSLATVKKDEDENKVLITIDGSGIWWVDAAYLELVTPVEELEPYSVGESSDYFSVDKADEELCLYWKDKHPHAKQAAEAERDRLNAEY